MTIEQKQNYIELLKKNNSSLANAILFYITNKNPEFEKKKQFVEKVIEKYGYIYSFSHGKYEECISITSIPEKIRLKLLFSYQEDLNQQKNQDETEEELISEMNEIF